MLWTKLFFLFGTCHNYIAELPSSEEGVFLENEHGAICTKRAPSDDSKEGLISDTFMRKQARLSPLSNSESWTKQIWYKTRCVYIIRWTL